MPSAARIRMIQRRLNKIKMLGSNLTPSGPASSGDSDGGSGGDDSTGGDSAAAGDSDGGDSVDASSSASAALG